MSKDMLKCLPPLSHWHFFLDIKVRLSISVQLKASRWPRPRPQSAARAYMEGGTCKKKLLKVWLWAKNVFPVLTSHRIGKYNKNPYILDVRVTTDLAVWLPDYSDKKHCSPGASEVNPDIEYIWDFIVFFVYMDGMDPETGFCPTPKVEQFFFHSIAQKLFINFKASTHILKYRGHIFRFTVHMCSVVVSTLRYHRRDPCSIPCSDEQFFNLFFSVENKFY